MVTNPNTILNSDILPSVNLSVKWEIAWYKFQITYTNPVLLISDFLQTSAG